MKGSFISKKESIIVQAFAVIMMVNHHLFTFPERISVDYICLFDFPSLHLELIIAAFCKICVSIFAFCSGYGLYKNFLEKHTEQKLIKIYKSSVKRILNFYSVFWLVFIIFIPIGFLIKVYSFHLLEFLKNFLAVSYDYNAEWWYAGYYVLFLLLFPLIFKVMIKAKNKTVMVLWAILSVLISIVLYINIFYFNRAYHDSFRFLTYLWCFITGAIFVHFNIFERIDSCIKKNLVTKIVFSFLGIVMLIIRMRFITGSEFDYYFSPIIIYFIMRIVKSKCFIPLFEKLFLFIGKYTIYIWLTHTFFSYYYLQSLTYAPKLSFLILFWNLLLSTVTGIILNLLRASINKYIKKKIKKGYQ